MPIYVLCRLCLLLHLCMIRQHSRQPFRPSICLELALRYGRNVSIIFSEGMLLCEILPVEHTVIRIGGDTTEIQLPHRDMTGRLPTSSSVESPTTKVVPSGYRLWKVGNLIMYLKYQNHKTTWRQAAAACKAEGASLIKIDSFYKDFMASRSVRAVADHDTKEIALWIGLHDKFYNNTWYWLDGDRRENTSEDYVQYQQIDFYYKLAGRGHCAVFRIGDQKTKTKWTDVDCHSIFHSLCELNA